jgi:hypothetical protein
MEAITPPPLFPFPAIQRTLFLRGRIYFLHERRELFLLFHHQLYWNTISYRQLIDLPHFANRNVVFLAGQHYLPFLIFQLKNMVERA